MCSGIRSAARFIAPYVFWKVSAVLGSSMVGWAGSHCTVSPLLVVTLMVSVEQDPLGYILDTWGMRHKGDRVLGTVLALSVFSCADRMSTGIHVATAGASGAGKTDAENKMAYLLPQDHVRRGGMSDKALLYDRELPKRGLVVVLDDSQTSIQERGLFVEMIKNATSDFQQPYVHRTVVDKQQVKNTISAAAVWWFTGVGASYPIELRNRLTLVPVENGVAHRRQVADSITGSWLCRDDDDGYDGRVLKCRELFQQALDGCYRVKIPTAVHFDVERDPNYRDINLYGNLARAYAVARRDFDGRMCSDGVVTVNAQDLHDASVLFGEIVRVSGIEKLTNIQQKLQIILDNCPEPNGYTVAEMVTMSQISDGEVRKALYGRNRMSPDDSSLLSIGWVTGDEGRPEHFKTTRGGIAKERGVAYYDGLIRYEALEGAV